VTVPFITTQDVSDLLGRDVCDDPGAFTAVTNVCDFMRAMTFQDFDRGTTTEMLDGTDTDVLLFPQRPVNGAGTAGTVNGQFGTFVTVNGQPETDFTYTYSGLLLRGSAGGYPRPIWPRGRQNVMVTYDHGYDVVPNDLRMVAIQMAMRLIVQGVAMSETVGDVTVNYAMSPTDLTVNELRILGGYIVPRSF
jgi:hypothetical protein